MPLLSAVVAVLTLLAVSSGQSASAAGLVASEADVPASARPSPLLPPTLTAAQPAAAPLSGGYPLPSGDFRPDPCSEAVDSVIRDAVAAYNLPRWFYYAIVQRESSFDPEADNGRDKGLTQMGDTVYAGRPYPLGLNAPDDAHRQYGWDLNFGKYGPWIRMSQVTPMTDWFDPAQNIDRFSTGYAVPAFNLFKDVYGLDDAETLRAVAYHWNRGMFVDYDPADSAYLELYDRYVAEFREPVEEQDGAWDGRPVLP